MIETKHLVGGKKRLSGMLMMLLGSLINHSIWAQEPRFTKTELCWL